MPKTRGLTIKRKKFVSAKVAGKTNHQAYLDAGYSATTRHVADVESSKLLNKPEIQDAINKALEFHGATPEFAVGNVKRIAEDVENNSSAALNANKLILQLHGWKEGERPDMTINVKNAFFNGNRSKFQNKEHQNNRKDDVIDV